MGSMAEFGLNVNRAQRKIQLICLKSSKTFDIEDIPPEFAFKSLNMDHIEDLIFLGTTGTKPPSRTHLCLFFILIHFRYICISGY